MTTNEQLQLNEVQAERNAPPSTLNTSFENPIGRGEQPDFSPSPDEVAKQSAQVTVPAPAPKEEVAAAATPAPAAATPAENPYQEKAGLFDTLMSDPHMASYIDNWAAERMGKPPIGVVQPQSKASQEDMPDWAKQLQRDNQELRQQVQQTHQSQARRIYDDFKVANPDIVKYEREVANYVQNQQLSLQDAYLLAKAKGNGVNEQQSQTVEGRTTPATTPSPQDDVQARIAAIPSTDGDRTAKATRIAFDAAVAQYHQ